MGTRSFTWLMYQDHPSLLFMQGQTVYHTLFLLWKWKRSEVAHAVFLRKCFWGYNVSIFSVFLSKGRFQTASLITMLVYTEWSVRPTKY
jgi:hypothetical protein